METAHVLYRALDRRVLLRRHRAFGGGQLLFRHGQRRKAHAVELLCEREQRSIAVAAHAIDDVARGGGDAGSVLERGALQGFALRRT
jgi:hypothetical protein